MRNKFWIIFLIVIFSTLVACGGDDENDGDDELAVLEVEFEPPETVDVGESVELEAIVTYGDEKVTDAKEVEFEVWEKGDRDNGDWIDADNHEDGTYTTEITFDHDGIFEMYAHTT